MTYSERFAATISVALVVLCTPTFAQPDGRRLQLVNQPAVSPDGNQIAFSWNDEIWSAAIDGTTLTRLTNHPASDAQPLFSPNGKRMYVAVGSTTNVAEQMPKKSMADIKAWEAEHGLGALWDLEADRAAVLVYEVGSDKPGKIFAAGLRNCVSVTLQPKTNDLWCTVNERDLLGDDLVPDYSTRVKQGGFYGWPWYYLGDNEDPRLKGERPDLRGKNIMPDVLFQAHSAALHLTFYPKGSGDAAFPAEYTGDAIVAFHGSWNRNFRTGYKLVRIRMKNGVPSNEYEDFLTGFIVDDGNVWGRPVATTVMKDGSLLVSDDGANQIHRIYYQR